MIHFVEVLLFLDGFNRW